MGAITGDARRVALALELGAADDDVLQHVRAQRDPARAHLILLHVVESAAGRYLGDQSSDQESRGDLATLETLARDLRARGFATEAHLGYGDVKSELARLVEETRADLLITGSHGHGLLLDLLFGATASGLRHRVRCPVLTIPSGRSKRSRAPVPTRR
ncbi:MAG: universal stress protein [Candidatus Eisenbacteria bacterium]|uniref:Universal stress protein n=1 Tax=Eiseniibacteriota bacterium TaxID=2212470 RepID=A0A538TZD2_UNCEI|nr:MAG: universal stress protein [Candidatus Eisenbacteria bacterium]